MTKNPKDTTTEAMPNSNAVRLTARQWLVVGAMLLALILMMGQYTGYKLTELKRFGVMRGGD